MIVTCEACTKRYQMDSTSFRNGRRRVRCAACGHVWTVAAPRDNFQRSKIGWIVWGIACSLVFASVIALGPLTHTVPVFAEFFGSQQESPLMVEKVTCSPRLENNQTFLVIKGTVRNLSEQPQDIPTLRVRLYGRGTGVDPQKYHPIEWVLPLDFKSLNGGDAKPFESQSPKPIGKDIIGCYVGF